MPFLSRLTFYGVGIPSGALALGLGIAAAADPKGDFAGFFLGDAILFAGFAAASTWWFYYSDDKHFRMHPTGQGPRGAGATLSVWPGGASGTF